MKRRRGSKKGLRNANCVRRQMAKGKSKTRARKICNVHIGKKR